jgi:hypothetical protein
MFFSACKRDIPAVVNNETVVNKDTTVVDSVKGVLLLHENFQKWNRAGYVQPVLHDCQADLMTSCTTISFLPTTVQVVYDSLTVNYSLLYYAVNPQCGNDAGTSTLTSDVSTGYVALEAPLSYVCFGHNLSSGAYIMTSVIPSVSVFEFSMSYSLSDVDYMLGVTLFKKGTKDTSFVKVKNFAIQYSPEDVYDTIVEKKISGQVFSATINEDSVQLMFTCIWPSGVPFNTTDPAKLKLLKNNNPSLYPIINREVRIHDLWVWRKKNASKNNNNDIKSTDPDKKILF